MTQVNQDASVEVTLPKWLKLGDESVTVTLRYRTLISGVLTMRAPKVAGNGDFEKQELSLFGSLVGLTEAGCYS